MTFLNPQGFLGLFLALPIIAVYLLRLHYTNYIVPSLSLWQSVLQDRYANRPWQKFKKHWLLILQLLVLVLLVFALAHPVFPAPLPQQERVFVLLDISASMLAQTDQGQSRFERAMGELQNTLSTFHNSDDLTLITVGDNPVVVVRNVDVKQIKDELSVISPIHGTADWASAAQLTRSLVGEFGTDNLMTIVVSDFASDDFPPSTSSSPEVLLPGVLYTINVGDNLANAGIVHFSIRQNNAEVTAFIRIQNAGPPATRTVDILADGVLFNRQKLNLPSNEDVTLTLNKIPAQSWVEVRLQETDAFSLDDRAWTVLDSEGRNAVLLVTSGNRFLSQALANLQTADYYQTNSLSAVDEDNVKFTVFVVDKTPLPVLPQSNLWLIAPDNESVCGNPKQEWFQPTHMNGKWQHPLLEYVDWSDVHLQRVQKYDIPDLAEVLLNSREGPVLWSVENGRYRAVCTAFKLQDSDLPLRLAFPILTSNIITWLSPHLMTEPQSPLTPGDLWRPSLPANTTAAVLIDVNQNKFDVPLDGSSIILYEVGLYQLLTTTSTAQKTSHVAVSLLNSQESDLRPRDTYYSTVNTASVEDAWGQYDLSRWLIGIVFILCCFEAYLWWGRGLRFEKEAIFPIRIRSGNLFAIILRLVLLVCLLGAFSGVRLKRKVRDLGIVFVVDHSESTRESWDEQQVLIKATLENKTARDQVAVVLFGRHAWIDRSLSADDRYAEFASIPLRDATDIEQAIRLATALIPSDLAGRIVLLSDGLETKGQGQKALTDAVNQGLDVFLIKTGSDAPSSEVWIDHLDVPGLIFPGDQVPLRVTLATNKPQVVRLNWSAGSQVGSAYFDLSVNESVYQISVQALSHGFIPVRVCVESELDFYLENNCADNWLVVQGTPKVVVVAPGDEGANLVAAIQAGGMDVIEVDPFSMPQTLEELAVYSAVILVNTPIRDIPLQSLSNLDPYIRDLGGGLITIGGPQSYGVGGWLGTQLEEVLPVEMRVQDPQRFPPMVMSLIIDTSGSMASEERGVAKIKIAAEAALRATESLNVGDTLLVVGYSDGPDQTIGPIVMGGEARNVRQRLYGLQAGGGGIFVYESLAYVSDLMTEIPLQTNSQRHILLLADGGDAEHQQGVLGLVDQTSGSGISTSSISIGSGRDVAFLEALADAGQGRFYLANNASDLPAIFSEEVARVKRSYIVEELITPKITTAWKSLDGTASFPSLMGYVATSPKASSETVLFAGEGDPILSVWQYGLGRSAAWTSDASDRWASNWIAWDEFASFWNTVLRDVLMQEMDPNINLSIRGEVGETKVAVDVTDNEGDDLDLYLRFSGTSQDEEDINVELEQVAPGRYETEVADLRSESYLVRLYGDRNFVIGWAPPSAQEYMPAAQDSAMTRLAAQSGARLIESYEEIVKRNITGGKQAQPLTIPLLLISALLWVSDVIWRRLSLSWEGLLGVVTRRIRWPDVKQKQTEKRVSPAEKTTVSDLIAWRKRRKLSSLSPSTQSHDITTIDVKPLDEQIDDKKTGEINEKDEIEEDVNIAARLRKGLRGKNQDGG